jgi:hypothetical protein
MIVVFSEISKNTSSINAREMQAITDAARMFGCHVYTIPSDFEVCETAENALAYVPVFEERILGVWVGYIPTYERYDTIYQAALRRNIHLVNTPDQYRRVMEFDQFYPLLGDLTPKSLILHDATQLGRVEHEIGYPVFVKGAVKSDKEAGWKAVVAHNESELRMIVERILSQPERSRGKVIVRQLVQLKILDEAPNGFPVAREYRVFLYKGDVLARGFYWDIDPPPLTRQEDTEILDTARKAAHRLETPYIAVDVGQLAHGKWIVIEVGDAQFCGLSHVPVFELWSKIKNFTF